MNNRLIIIGAGGHGKVIADNALKNGYKDISFLDDHAAGMCMGFPILGTSDRIKELDDGATDFIIGVGNNEIRAEIAERYDVNWVALIHPSAQISACVSIGKGTVVMAGAVVNACSVIGEHCIINTGTINGLSFTAVEEADAPADLTSTVTATLNMNPQLTATVQLNLGKGSVVPWDFEGGQEDIDIWNVINNRKNAAHWDYELALSLADRANGQVHDGNYSMRLETNGLSSKDSHSEQYAWIRLGVDGEAITLENARSVGFWLYVPEDNIQCWVQGHYMTDSNGDGVVDTENVVSMMESENVYYNIDESGWHYLSMDISAFEKIALKAAKQYDKDPSDGMTGETGEFFLALVFHKAINNMLWAENGSINGTIHTIWTTSPWTTLRLLRIERILSLARSISTVRLIWSSVMWLPPPAMC